MSQRIIKIDQLKEPERYETLYEAMMDGTQVEGGYVMQYTEYDDAGELVCKFTLRDPDDKLPDSDAQQW